MPRHLHYLWKQDPLKTASFHFNTVHCIFIYQYRRKHIELFVTWLQLNVPYSQKNEKSADVRWSYHVSHQCCFSGNRVYGASDNNRPNPFRDRTSDVANGGQTWHQSISSISLLTQSNIPRVLFSVRVGLQVGWFYSPAQSIQPATANHGD